jgi:glycosyltransferase involved in cell wall biosynthesis
MRIERLLGHPTIQRIMRRADRDTVLFFFWGLGTCDIVPFLEQGPNRPLTAARMHRYDLFEYAARGYMPYRRPLLDALSYAFPSSQAGADHLRRHYPGAKAAIQVGRMGVIGEGRSEASTDATLRIVTCSYLRDVKRVHLVAEALRRLDFPLHWTHLGDGPLRPDLERRIASLPAHITVKLEGMIDSTKVLSYYKQHPIDLFINVSSSEGVPFSIMEAFSAGIPVAATDVGGTAEIVDDGVGRILPADVDANGVAAMLRAFAALSPAQRLIQRDAAFRRYQERCDANRLSREMAELLNSV